MSKREFVIWPKITLAREGIFTLFYSQLMLPLVHYNVCSLYGMDNCVPLPFMSFGETRFYEFDLLFENIEARHAKFKFHWLNHQP